MGSRVGRLTVNRAALANVHTILNRWLPDGRLSGSEYTALNPTRDDRHLGSFKINVQTGRWCDFATGDKGRDLIALAAYLHGSTRPEAAVRLAGMLGLL